MMFTCMCSSLFPVADTEDDFTTTGPHYRKLITPRSLSKRVTGLFIFINHTLSERHFISVS